MRKGTPRIGVELLLVGLILGLLGGSMALIIRVYRQRPVERTAPVVAVAPAEPAPEPEAVAEAEPEPQPPASPPPASVDPTTARLKAILSGLADRKVETEALDRRSAEMEKAAVAALAEADRYRTRELLIRREVASRERETRAVEDEVEALARERDILAQKRDEQRAKLEQARLHAKDGVAVLPYKGPNGTWRRPIAIECRGGTATLQPDGPSFTMVDLAGFGDPRFSPLVLAVAKTLVRIRDLATPDGAPSVPYLLFVVRPDGIRPYYAARALLEPLGISYGYELADADWDIEFPDLNDPSEWPGGTGPKASPAWPPPPSSGERSGGFGPGRFDARPGSRGGYGAADGPGAGPGSSGVPGDTFDGGGGHESAGPFGRGGGPIGGQGDAPGGLPGSPAGARVLPTPGDGRGTPDRGRGAGASPWGRLDGRSGGGGGGGSGLDEVDLEALSRGIGRGREIPRDGRVPIMPGFPNSPPRFAPTPPAELREVPDNELELPRPGGSGAPAEGTLGSDPSLAGMGGGAGSGTGTGGTTIAALDPARSPTNGISDRTGGGNTAVVGTSSARTMREAIARGQGLEAPKGLSGAKPAARSAGSQAARGSASGSSGSPASPGSTGVPGGLSGGGSGSGEGGGAGWDTSNGIQSESLEMTVACGPTGVTIYPGGETIPIEKLKADDRLLPAKLTTIVNKRRDADPMMGLRPKVRFLMKPGGESTYLKARWQTAAAGTGWPLLLQVADRSPARPFGGGTR